MLLLADKHTASGTIQNNNNNNTQNIYTIYRAVVVFVHIFYLVVWRVAKVYNTVQVPSVAASCFAYMHAATTVAHTTKATVRLKTFICVRKHVKFIREPFRVCVPNRCDVTDILHGPELRAKITIKISFNFLERCKYVLWHLEIDAIVLEEVAHQPIIFTFIVQT